jgi:hypothetical protein
LPPLEALAPPALPNSEEPWPACPPAELVPKSEGDAVPLVDEAPTFPNKPPLDPVFELFWLEPKVAPDVPKRPPLEVPLEAGVPKENDMTMSCRDRGNR